MLCSNSEWARFYWYCTTRAVVTRLNERAVLSKYDRGLFALTLIFTSRGSGTKMGRLRYG